MKVQLIVHLFFMYSLLHLLSICLITSSSLLFIWMTTPNFTTTHTHTHMREHTLTKSPVSVSAVSFCTHSGRLRHLILAKSRQAVPPGRKKKKPKNVLVCRIHLSPLSQSGIHTHTDTHIYTHTCSVTQRKVFCGSWPLTLWSCPYLLVAACTVALSLFQMS